MRSGSSRPRVEPLPALVRPLRQLTDPAAAPRREARRRGTGHRDRGLRRTRAADPVLDGEPVLALPGQPRPGHDHRADPEPLDGSEATPCRFRDTDLVDPVPQVRTRLVHPRHTHHRPAEPERGAEVVDGLGGNAAVGGVDALMRLLSRRRSVLATYPRRRPSCHRARLLHRQRVDQVVHRVARVALHPLGTLTSPRSLTRSISGSHRSRLATGFLRWSSSRAQPALPPAVAEAVDDVGRVADDDQRARQRPHRLEAARISIRWLVVAGLAAAA